jgi:hypothetical protein
MKLDDMLAIGCDIELKLDDGTMPANSVTLRMMSDVFNNALDTQNGCLAPSQATQGYASASEAASPTILPLPGITKQQWRRVAEFLYPVAPFPSIEDWEEAEELLEVSVLCLSPYSLTTVVLCASCTQLYPGWP